MKAVLDRGPLIAAWSRRQVHVRLPGLKALKVIAWGGARSAQPQVQVRRDLAALQGRHIGGFPRMAV